MEAAAVSPDPAEVTTLPVVEVQAESLQPLPAGHVLGDAVLRAIPAKGASPNELLRIVPGVQLGEEAQIGDQGGELIPPAISIAGEKTFQNSFLIDGFGNNSFLDPELRSTFAVSTLPDHPQGVFLHTTLIEELTLYDSNISARFGDFKGGVVDIRTRTPVPDFYGELRMRGTRDEWTSFHHGPDGPAEFQSSASETAQPNFTRLDSGVLLNLPLRPQHAAILAYQREESDIPLSYLGGSRSQKRRLENLFLKTRHVLQTDLAAEFLLASSPYVSKHFYANSLDSGYRIDSRDDLVGLTVSGDLAAGAWTTQLAYNASESRRDAPPNLYSWAITPSRPWGTLAGTNRSIEGMLGDLEREHDGLQFKADWESAPWVTGRLSQRLDAGVNLERQRAEFVRAEDTLLYSPPTTGTPVCPPGDEACVDGEQYFRTRLRYPADDVSVRLDRYEAYLEDTLELGRLTLRPGVRVSYDDLNRNTNFAPRLATWYDLFGDGASILGAGANRYYGRALVSYKLREVAKPFTRETRTYDPVTTTFSPWAPASPSGNAYRYSDLETPYSDELTGSLEQSLFGGRARLAYIHREGKDEYARERTDIQPDGWRYYELNNRGRSRHEEVQLSWVRDWSRHHLEVNATWQETRTSTNSYDDSFDALLDQEKIWFEGQVIGRDELPRPDYNRPYVVNLMYHGTLPRGFFFTNVTTWRDGYQAIDDIPIPAEAPPEVADAYGRIERPSVWTTDWKLGWRTAWRHNVLQLTVEAYNVFNEKAAVADSEDEFEMGRQIWVGLELFF